jgi:hypothetical protein
MAAALGLSSEQVEHVIKDITSKRQATAYLRTKPLGVEG